VVSTGSDEDEGSAQDGADVPTQHSLEDLSDAAAGAGPPSSTLLRGIKLVRGDFVFDGLSSVGTVERAGPSGGAAFCALGSGCRPSRLQLSCPCSADTAILTKPCVPWALLSQSQKEWRRCVPPTLGFCPICVCSAQP